MFTKAEALDALYEGNLISVEAVGDLGLATSQDDLLALSTGGGFLPRIQLYGGNSGAVQEGKIGVGHYGLVRDKDRIEDLTGEVEVLVVTGRAKAMQIDGETIITVYDRKSEEFQRIAQESETPDSGCMFGPEFLLFIPAAQSFATFFMSSKTARREAGALSNRIGKAAILKAKLIVGKKYKWHGPVVEAFESPTFEIPNIDDIKTQASSFLNPKAMGPEKAEDAGEERAR